MKQYILLDNDSLGDERLGQLFNAYLAQLVSLEQTALPRHSLAEYTRLLARDEAEGTNDVGEMGQQLYGLQVLSYSLTSLYYSLSQACLDLEVFVTEGEDFTHCAALLRLEQVELYGSDDPADFEPDGTVKLREEPAALADYRLPRRLRPYFASGLTNSPHGEPIGASGPADFQYFSNLVANEVRFARRDEHRPPTPDNLTTYRRDEAPEPVSGEGKESDTERFTLVDSAFRGPVIVVQFNQVLTLCQEAAALYSSLQDLGEDTVAYKYLYRLIRRIIDGEW